MICPHCEKSLLRKERPGNVCGFCRRTYALDPKTNDLRLSDLRVRRVMGTLTDQGQLPCTPGQLWYALSRKSLRESGVQLGCGCLPAYFGAALCFVGLITRLPLVAVGGGLLLLVALGLLIAKQAGVGRGRPKIARSAFRSGPLAEWRRVYGSLPPGMVDDDRLPDRADDHRVSGRAGDHRPPYGQAVPAAAATAALICPDLSVAVCLAAAGVPARHGLTLLTDPRRLTGYGPVIVLHDASAQGLLLVRRLRVALPGRTVIDAGLPLRRLRESRGAVPFRDTGPSEADMAELAASGEFTPAELKWLAKGWSYPLVGVPPARLLAVVDRVAERVTTAADPQRRRAASLGFLTWPAPPVPPMPSAPPRGT
ncbi:hypothetical protein [Streptomyces sp. NPDC050535]|uniref:hypothetical protein n=1 Tax=Streptomyces sp. NPDC050535 TaxID=3365626 RepID=UPI0037981E94